MKEEFLTMSTKEINRLHVMEQLAAKRLKQPEAAQALGISTRQVKRLFSSFKAHGPEGLISRKRGKLSNHQCPTGFKHKALELISDKYHDFGPTLAQEYLHEHDGITLSVETVRRVMIAGGLWKVKQQRKAMRVHQQRERRERFGELVQLDGSTHDWFEGRAPKCCLHVLVDDATSAILGLHFAKAETTFGYFALLQSYLLNHGAPVAFYTDKHGIFRINLDDAKTGDGHTQFSRAMEELGIEIIFAHSPQAKGRVERANSTLQDRLIKAMRLMEISSIEEANAFLPEFIADYNERFAKQPKNGANAHRELAFDKAALAHILCRQTYRTLTKNLECSYDNVIYQIQAQERKRRLFNKRVKICETVTGDVDIFLGEEQLDYVIFNESKQRLEADDKTINLIVDGLIKEPQPQQQTPILSPPWNEYGCKRKTVTTRPKHELV